MFEIAGIDLLIFEGTYQQGSWGGRKEMNDGRTEAEVMRTVGHQ